MNSTSKYKDTQYGMIGIVESIPIVEAEVVISDKYSEFEIKRLTKANSFTVCGEVLHIGKKNPEGKASKTYHITRVSDNRYVCQGSRDKDKTIEMVQRKWIELDLCGEGSTLF